MHIEQNKLIGPDGKSLRLNAVNLGGWLLWEGWIMGAGLQSETEIKSRMQQLLPEAEYRAFLKSYYYNFITEKDFEAIAASGFNAVRVPFNYRLFAKDAAVDGFAVFDSLLQWGRKHRVYIIPDMHGAPGGQNRFFIADPQKPLLWQSPENRKATIELWRAIATRYKDEVMIAGYDLLNEPDANAIELQKIYDEITAAIRSADKNHLLIIEGANFAKDFNGMPSTPKDSNAIYSFHYYAWFGEGSKGPDVAKTLAGIKGSRPVWCGEWGEDSPANIKEVSAIFKANPNICGTAFWTWKKVQKNEKLPPCGIRNNAAWRRISDWLTWKIFKPNKTEITNGFADFLNSIKFENCIWNKDLIANSIL